MLRLRRCGASLRVSCIAFVLTYVFAIAYDETLRAAHSANRKGAIMRQFSFTVGLVLLTASSVSAATLLVDDDLVQCPSAPYTTIQAAVAAAAAGDTVKLCAGSYGGQVVVTVPLRITGKAPNVKTCGALPALNPAAYSIFDAPAVAGPGGIGIDVLADSVRIEKLVVRNAGEAGIRTDPANVKFGLKSVVFTQNVNGIYFHSAVASKSYAKGNCFDANGTGIRVGYGLRDAKIEKNLFVGSNVGAALLIDQLSAVTSDNLKILKNTSESDATFAVILGTNSVVLAKNKIVGAPTTGTAIFVGGNNFDLLITGNSIVGAGTRGIRFNTQFFPGFPPSGPSTNVTVVKNTIINAGTHGISIESGAGEASLVSSLVLKNTVTGSGDSGAGDGIRVEDPLGTGTNNGNQIVANTLGGSANHDCHDASIGGFTAGTANVWNLNTAATQSVAGLCFTGAANGVAD